MSETKTYNDHLENIKKDSKINNFIKLSQHPLLVEMDKLIRSHAKSPHDVHNIDLRDPDIKKQYSEFCKTKDSDNPVIGDKIKDFCEYYLMRRNLEHYVYCWDSCLRQYCDDVVLFK